MGRVGVRRGREWTKSFVTIVIPVRNEERILGPCLESIAAPGAGISSGGSIANLQLGPADYVVPPAIGPSNVSFTASPHSVDLWWPIGADDPNGIGLANYVVYANGNWLASPAIPNWVDDTETPGAVVTYALYAVDQHDNYSPPTTINVTVPPTTQPDQRRIGVRPTGAYWGAAGEQIDLLSGNLNFSVPLFQAMGRGWQPSTRSSALRAPCCSKKTTPGRGLWRARPMWERLSVS